MARKSLIQPKRGKQKFLHIYHLIRRSSGKEISKVASLSEKWAIHGKLQWETRKIGTIRLHRRSFLTGRPRPNYRDFRLSDSILREMVHGCLLPGATRSSW
uniref:Ribosomal protein S14 n=1 Tax=Pisum sativum TaxID=3888 RepID=A0A2H4MY20_PEA|nr:ribosomal protein S14 [Pisum sativum]